MCYHAYVTKHVNDPLLSVVRKGHCVPLAGFCLPLYNLHMLNRYVYKRHINYINILTANIVLVAGDTGCLAPEAA